MGLRGPPKTPTKILEARGSWRALDRKNEPTPEGGAPRCPDWIRGHARRHWRETAKLLDDMGVLTKIDRDALAIYCRQYTRWRECQEFLAAHDLTQSVETDAGIVEQQWPQAREAISLVASLLRYQQQFGLTPSARAGMVVGVKKEKVKDGKSRFFKMA